MFIKLSKIERKISFLLLKSTNMFFKFGKVEIELSVSAKYLIFVDVSCKLFIKSFYQTHSIFILGIF